MVEQQIAITAKEGVSWAQIFYYTAGGGAAIAVTVKTWLVIYNRWKNRKKT